MRFEVLMVSANNYAMEEILQEIIPDEYFLDEQGEVSIAGSFYNNENTINELMRFLFSSKEPVSEIYRDEEHYVLDLSALREHLIDFHDLELSYPKWIEETGRENSMDEYGELQSFVSYAIQSKNRKYLLMVVAIT